jgi:hypothetical protein
MADAETEANPKRIPLRMAVNLALSYFQQVYSTLEATNVALEEIEESENGRYWFVTIGFDAKRKLIADPPPFQILPEAFRPQSEVKRSFKTFKIDAEKEKVLSMKVYQPSS